MPTTNLSRSFTKNRSKPFLNTLMVSFFALLMALSHQESIAQANKPTPLIIDTDMGTDDWLAIAYIAQNKNIDLLGITIVGNGIASCTNASNNAQYILNMSERNAKKPIGCGSNWPMDGYASYPKIWRQTGADMMEKKSLRKIPRLTTPIAQHYLHHCSIKALPQWMYWPLVA